MSCWDSRRVSSSNPAIGYKTLIRRIYRCGISRRTGEQATSAEQRYTTSSLPLGDTGVRLVRRGEPCCSFLKVGKTDQGAYASAQCKTQQAASFRLRMAEVQQKHCTSSDAAIR